MALSVVTTCILTDLSIGTPMDIEKITEITNENKKLSEKVIRQDEQIKALRENLAKAKQLNSQLLDEAKLSASFISIMRFGILESFGRDIKKLEESLKGAKSERELEGLYYYDDAER